MTYIEEYYNKIMSGEIVACHRIKQVYSMLVDKLHHPEKYHSGFPCRPPAGDRSSHAPKHSFWHRVSPPSALQQTAASAN